MCLVYVQLPNHFVLHMISPVLIDKCSNTVVRPCIYDKNRPPWCRDHVYFNLNVDSILEKELVEFGQWVQLTPEELAMRSIVIKRFQSICKEIFPDAKLHCYGSTATRTCLFNGDIDLCITDLPDDISNTTALNEFMTKSEVYKVFDKVEFIDAKVPILKGVESCFKFRVDISAQDSNCLLNIPRNMNVMRAYPAIFPVLMLIKIILAEHEFNEIYTGGISSTILFNMVHFIVQMSPPEHKHNPAKILLGFLSQYGGTFNFIKNAISTVNGGRIVESAVKFDFCIQCVDPQTHNIISNNHSKHISIVQLFMQLRNKLNDYTPYDSFLTRLVDIKYIHKLEKLREDSLKNFKLLMDNGQSIKATENISQNKRKSWSIISEYVVQQAKYIKNKHSIDSHNAQTVPSDTNLSWQRQFYTYKPSTMNRRELNLPAPPKIKEQNPYEEQRSKTEIEKEQKSIAAQLEYIKELLAEGQSEVH